jgi:hypothetical protein
VVVISAKVRVMRNIEDLELMTLCKAMEFSNTYQEQYIQENGLMESIMVKELMNSLKDRFMLDNEKIIKCMVKEYLLMSKENNGRDYL